MSHIELSPETRNRLELLVKTLSQFPLDLTGQEAHENERAQEVVGPDGTKSLFQFNMEKVYEHTAFGGHCGSAGCLIGLDWELNRTDMWNYHDVEDMMNDDGFENSKEAIFFGSSLHYSTTFLRDVTPKEVIERVQQFLADPLAFEAMVAKKGE